MSNDFNANNFKNLITRITENYYGDPETLSTEDVEDLISKEVERIKSIKTKETIVHLEKPKKDDILNALKAKNHMTIGKFTVKILNNTYIIKNSDEVSLIIYEETKPNMLTKVNFIKDIRFKDRDWAKHMDDNSLSIDTAVEVIRWLHAMNKMTNFI